MPAKVYVGKLGNRGDKQEIYRAFKKYGSIVDVWVARNPPGFAFVEFDDERDAKDAVNEMDGSWLCGEKVQVELSHGQRRGDRGGRGGRGRGRYDDYRPRAGRSPPRRRSRSRSRSPPPRRERSPVGRYDRQRSRSPSPGHN